MGRSSLTMIPGPAGSRHAGDLHVGPLAQRQHLRADGAGRVEPGERGDHQRHHVDAHAFAQGQRHDDQHHQVRHGEPDVDGPAHEAVHPATVIGRDEGQRGADEDADEAGDQPDPQRQQGAGGDHGEKVAALAIAAERQRPGRRLEHAGRQRPGVVGVDQPAADDGEADEADEEQEADQQRLVAADIEELRPYRLRQQPARRLVGEDGVVSRQGVDVSFSDRRCAGRAAGRRGRGSAWPGRWR